MEEIFGVILEILGELFLAAGCSLFAAMADAFNTNSTFRKVMKYLFAIILFTGCLILVILSFFYNTDIYIYLASSYIGLLLILYVIKFLSKNGEDKENMTLKVTTWILRISHHVFPIVLIIISSICYNNKGTPFVITFSSIALFIFILIDIYKYNRRKVSYKTFVKYQERYREEYENDTTTNYLNKLVGLYSRNLDHLKTKIKNANDEEMSLFMETEYLPLIKKINSIEFINFIELNLLKHVSLDYKESIALSHKIYTQGQSTTTKKSLDLTKS